MKSLFSHEHFPRSPDPVYVAYFYTATTETGATQTMKTNYRAERKQYIPTFSNRANQMSGTIQRNLNLFVDR